MIAAALCLALVGQVRDARTGEGLPGVEVSNGRDLAVTDPGGRYELPDEGRFVFVIKPSGWIAEGRTPDWYGPRRADGPPVPSDFALKPHREASAFRAIVLTDPQPSNAREVGYLRRSLGEPLARLGADERADFALVLGDITYDRPDLYPAIDDALRRMGLPWFPVNGNHDLNLGIAGEGAIAPYERLYGPSTYAFHWGPALFIALNDVRHEGGPRYRGGLLPEHWSLLEALLGRTPPATPLVLFFHIPLFRPDPFGADVFPRSDRDRLFRMLRPFGTVALLSGHTHLQRHVFYRSADGWEGAAPLAEYNVAAACGGFWSGADDAAGIPRSTMSDGTPPGYALLSVSAAGFRLEYRRRPDLGPTAAPEASIGLHVPAVVPLQQGYVPFFANVYDGDERWTVTAQIDDREPLPMRPVLAWDPAYAAAYLAQDAQGAILTPHPRLPEPSLCFHLWKAILPGDLAAGEHHVRVEARAPDGRAPVLVRTFAVAPRPQAP